MTARSASLPPTCRGKLLLLLLCAVQFFDVVDSSIMNVAQPSIRRDLGHRPRAGDLLRHRHRAHHHAARPAHRHPRRPRSGLRTGTGRPALVGGNPAPPGSEPLAEVLVKESKEIEMKFLLQVRFNGADKVIGTLSAEEQKQVTGEFEAIRRSPGVLDGNQLQAAGTAATVRVGADGQVRVTEGPAVGTGSELDGYYLYDAPGPDAAIAFAARIPVARFGGTVEVRPMLER